MSAEAPTVLHLRRVTMAPFLRQRGAPPASLVSRGVALLAPEVMARARVGLGADVELRGRGSGRAREGEDEDDEEWVAMARAWPAAGMARDKVGCGRVGGEVQVRILGGEVDEGSRVVFEDGEVGQLFERDDGFAEYFRAEVKGRCLCVGCGIEVLVLGEKKEVRVFEVDSVGGEECVRVGEGTVVEFVRGEREARGELGDIGGLGAEVELVVDLARESFGSGDGPRGVLLYGPPGTGKTLIAVAVAAEVGARLEMLSAPEVVGALAGESEASVARVFKRARRRRPCVVVLDEVDAIAGRRDGGGSGAAERRVTAAVLTEMDGGGVGGDGVFVIGTTNRVAEVDAAMRRAGRFDREVEVGVPSAKGREDVLRKLVEKARGIGRIGVRDVELVDVARISHGFVGADLAALWRETVSAALKRSGMEPGSAEGDFVIEREDFDAGLRLVKPSALREVAVEVPMVRWDDVGGMEDVKMRLREAVEMPLSAVGMRLFRSVGISPPRGLLLYGPPGCSKTLLAKAVATESGANFISVKGPELLSKWVGESEKAVRATFRRARLSAPCVIFFDEIDALAQARGVGGSAQSRVVAQLLTEMDGIEGGEDCPLNEGGASVVVIAATNRPDLLDPALVRPGRLGVQLYVGLPDEATREAILAVHLSRVPLAADVDEDSMASDGGPAEGMSGAELAAVVREAALAAMEENVSHACVVGRRHFERAFRRVRPRTPQSMMLFFEQYSRRSNGPAAIPAISLKF